ncbi:MAG: hypothetical protein F7B20_01980 [Aeropyrum sp.]|nr:hypothetical protein [Aeropyrum sp.]MCE4615887.1 hypothetical protein [Aeropyrum sp.]
MTLGLDQGTNAMGHEGWTRVRCRVCATYMDITGQPPGGRKIDLVYACPKCARDYNAYFCRADARSLKYRCPFCGSELVVISPVTTTQL